MIISILGGFCPVPNKNIYQVNTSIDIFTGFLVIVMKNTETDLFPYLF